MWRLPGEFPGELRGSGHDDKYSPCFNRYFEMRFVGPPDISPRAIEGL